MSETSGQTGNGLGGVDGCARDEPVHLDGAKGKVLGERVAGRDELGALLDGGTSSGLVRFVHDESEVLGSEERRDGGLDGRESFLEPLQRLAQVWSVLQLPVGQRMQSWISRGVLVLAVVADVPLQPIRHVA